MRRILDRLRPSSPPPADTPPAEDSRAPQDEPAPDGALELLLRRRGKVVSRSEIQARIWEDSFDLSTNIIDVYINALRKKIDGGDREKLIQTVRGVGYRVREPESPA